MLVPSVSKLEWRPSNWVKKNSKYHYYLYVTFVSDSGTRPAQFHYSGHNYYRRRRAILLNIVYTKKWNSRIRYPRSNNGTAIPSYTALVNSLLELCCTVLYYSVMKGNTWISTWRRWSVASRDSGSRWLRSSLVLKVQNLDSHEHTCVHCQHVPTLIRISFWELQCDLSLSWCGSIPASQSR